MRYSIKDYRAVVARYVRNLESLGLLPDGYEVEATEGSKINGIAYRVNFVDRARGGGHSRPIGGDYLGKTISEACQTLQDRCSVLEDIAYVADLTGIRDQIVASFRTASRRDPWGRLGWTEVDAEDGGNQ